MKKASFSIVLFILVTCSVQTFAQQTVLDGNYVKDIVKSRKVIPLQFLREADVFWSRKIWRDLPLAEKMNLPLKYPDKIIKDRKPLASLIHDAVKEGGIQAYSPRDEEFGIPMTKEELEKVGGAKKDSIDVPDPDNPNLTVRKERIIPFIPYEKVIAFRVKEDVFFDKQRSVLEYRIIGIAPLVREFDENGQAREGGGMQVLYWIYYPEARQMLATNEVFNRMNDAERRSFDDVFIKRMFSSVIIKESNVFDRRIADYRTGLDQVIESESIKEDIVNFEHDLWEY